MNIELGDLERETADVKEIQEREKHPAWILKNIACQTSARLIQKFGNPTYTPNKEFAMKFC